MSTTIQAGYLVAAVLFVLGLKGLARPRTAVRGNLFGSLGMLVAVVVTLTNETIVTWPVLVAGLVAGTGVGVLLATRVQMTSMPELVALFNGFGGAASVLVVGASSDEVLGTPSEDLTYLTAAAISAVIGALAFVWTLIAMTAGSTPADEGMLFLAGTALGTIVPAAGLYAASYRTSLGAARLERALDG